MIVEETTGMLPALSSLVVQALNENFPLIIE